MGKSKEDLSGFPDDVKDEAGFAIYAAQVGMKAPNAIPMVGYGGANVLEVVMNADGDTYRAVYTVRFENAIYVLHAFQKKSKKGDETPKPDKRLINQRLKDATKHHEENYKSQKRGKKNDRGA